MIRISKELIERYHREECSAEECRAVEDWLLSDNSDDELVLPEYENKAEQKKLIWHELEAFLPEEKIHPASAPVRHVQFRLWKRAVAAFIAGAVLIAGIYALISRPGQAVSSFVSVNNTSSLDIKRIDSRDYNISIGPKTYAQINYRTGMIDFSGSMLIHPKEDVELIFHGNEEKVHLKMGQTYIALTGNSTGDRIIIVNEKNLMDLPPVIQKQVINQFSI